MQDRKARHLQALGARILSEANDLKRTPEALARELNRDPATVRRVIAGEADEATARSLLTAMAEAYPISLADLWVEADDTEDGVKVMRRADSDASSRVFERKDRAGSETPYYDYRDTAMSRLAPFKPEWIRPLRLVEDSDPDNPDVAYNNGHLMHQLTFFVGAVNFYWRIDGRGYCAEMNTGDSNYITPFVRHSFTSRDPRRLGLIIAVTYAGEVRGALDALRHLEGPDLDRLAGDLRDPQGAFAARIVRALAAESLTSGELMRRLVDAGLDEEAAAALAAGARLPQGAEVAALAAALDLRPADLMVSQLTPKEEVVVRTRARSPSRAFPPDSNRAAYRLTELARTKHQPGLKGFEVTVLAEDTGDAVLRHGLHEYVYNYGDAAVALNWGDRHQTELAPGDSAYVRPMIGHRFARPTGEGEGHLAIVRVAGSLMQSVLDEFALYPAETRRRVVRETKRWF
ncbi:MAG: hypothetical protein ACE5JZ_00280 [Kiloniellales bacterium]